jgi:hypothetical protein
MQRNKKLQSKLMQVKEVLLEQELQSWVLKISQVRLQVKQLMLRKQLKLRKQKLTRNIKKRRLLKRLRRRLNIRQRKLRKMQRRLLMQKVSVVELLLVLLLEP